jgi:hypothetical protein
MPKYIVTGYITTPVWVHVEADNEDDALDLGSDVLTDGNGIHGDSTWHDDFDVQEEMN